MTPPTTYDQFVQHELNAAASAYRARHGRLPGIPDLAHLAWQRLVERRQYDNWLLAVREDDVPWVHEPEPGGPEPSPEPDPDPAPDPEPGPGPPGRRTEGTFGTASGWRWSDGRGAHTPVVLHTGELFSIWVRDEAKAVGQVRDARRRGFHAARPWMTLNVVHRDESYWRDRDVGPIHTPDYWSRARRFTQMCGNEGLRLRLSFGDLKGLTDAQETDLFTGWAEIVEGARDAFLMVEGLNEARDTGDSDDREPAEIERLVNLIRQRVPDLVYELSSFTGTEDADTLRAWTPAWQKHLLLHDYRDGHVSDKARHAWNAGYELAKVVRSDLRLVNHGEPAGNGPWVSATENKHELDDPEAMHLYLASMKVGRGIPTFFCSMGVKADGPGDRFDRYAGYTTVCEVLSHIPDEAGGWTLVHGGQREGSARVFAVPREGYGDPETRADHAIDEASGRFAAVLHSPDRRSWRHCTTARPHVVEWTHDCGDWGRIVVGRLR